MSSLADTEKQSNQSCIIINVLYFAGAREISGTAHEVITSEHINQFNAVLITSKSTLLTAPYSLENMIKYLDFKYPKLKPLLQTCMFAVNEMYQELDCILNSGDTLAIIPTVSGG